LRIGLLIYGALQTITGGYIYDRKLVAHLRAAGDDVHILSLPWRSYVHHMFYNLSYALIKTISALELDILLEDELNHPSCIFLNQRLKKRECPCVISIVHHLRRDENKRTGHTLQLWIEREYLRSVDGFIFNSRTTASSVARFADPKPSVIAYPGKDRFSSRVTKKEITQRCREKGPLRIVFLGNITPRKGLSTLIRALSSLPSGDWRLTVIGGLDRDRKYSNAMLELARQNALDKNIIFTGQISDAEVARYLRRDHILAVPSHYEGFGMVYAEAMGFGLPALGTTAGGAGEIIEHNVNGFLVAPDDSSALAEYLRSLHKDRLMLERMSKNCLKIYNTLPSWQETGNRIHDFLCAIKDRRPYINSLITTA
jgi:glycosyltransferase involved in cell wall biosynthesis